ncbi:MAG: DUF1659 domain-containing protein [Synergistaceae bacterium]|jgi:hypothetical protein|nr:DUF1659 domain-containing protein [Synergistaceae bacterium]
MQTIEGSIEGLKERKIQPSTLKRSSVAVKISTGTNPASGTAIIKSVTLSDISPTAATGAIMGVVGAMIDVLAGDYMTIERTIVSVLEN